MNKSAGRPGAAASSRAAARMSSSVALTSRPVSSEVNGLPSLCTNRWPAPVRATSKSVAAPLLPAARSWWGPLSGRCGRLARRHGRRLPVVRVLAVRTGAIQRPSGEPAPVADPAAQRAGNGRAGKGPTARYHS